MFNCASLLLVKAMYCELRSILTAFLSKSLAAIRLFPIPTNGYNTNSPLSIKRQIHFLGKAIGNTAGCISLSLISLYNSQIVTCPFTHSFGVRQFIWLSRQEQVFLKSIYIFFCHFYLSHYSIFYYFLNSLLIRQFSSQR